MDMEAVAKSLEMGDMDAIAKLLGMNELVAKAFVEANDEGKKRMIYTLMMQTLRNRTQGPPKDVGDGWYELDRFPVPGVDFRNFQKEGPDGIFILIVEKRNIGKDGDDPKLFPDGRWHMSMSHNAGRKNGNNIPGRIPTWDELKEARYKFIPGDVNMAIMFPPTDNYFNLHATCLHLLQIPNDLALNVKVGI